MRTWCDDVIDLVGETEPPLEAVTSLSDDQEHSFSVARELARALFPAVQFENGEMSLSPFNTGCIIGHKLAFAQQMGTTSFPSRTVTGIDPTSTAIRNLALELENCEEWKKEITDKVSESLRIALNQKPNDTAEFFRGFNAALERGSLTETGHLVGEGSTTTISFLLMMQGNTLSSKFGSTNEFHEFLVKLLGANVAGDLERTRQICARWKVRFKKRGRPRKSDKVTKSLS